jgi:predicted anti-sigma-YlaC factor YlaD
MGQMRSACRIAREQISLELDGELSEFERAALDGHLNGCGDCCTYAASAAHVSAHIRKAPLEQPQFPVVLPHRSRIRVPLRTAQAAAAAAVVAVVGFSAAGIVPSAAERSISLSAGNTQVDRTPNLSPERVARASVDFRIGWTAPRAVHGRIIAL